MNAPKPPTASNPAPRDPIIRALSRTTARVRAADRALAQVLHPSVAGNLTEEQRAAVETAREQVRAVPADLRAAASEHTAARTVPAVLPPNVIPLFRAAAAV